MARPYSKAILPRYLEIFLRSEAGKQLLLISSKAVAQPSISMEQSEQLPSRYPHQKNSPKSFRRIESAFGWLDRMAPIHAAAGKLLPKLDSAILAKAFRGELVPQDPNDEPASALLDRIRVEPEDAPRKTGRRKGHRHNDPDIGTGLPDIAVPEVKAARPQLRRSNR